MTFFISFKENFESWRRKLFEVQKNCLNLEKVFFFKRKSYFQVHAIFLNVENVFFANLLKLYLNSDFGTFLAQKVEIVHKVFNEERKTLRSSSDFFENAHIWAKSENLFFLELRFFALFFVNSQTRHLNFKKFFFFF